MLQPTVSLRCKLHFHFKWNYDVKYENQGKYARLYTKIKNMYYIRIFKRRPYTEFINVHNGRKEITKCKHITVTLKFVYEMRSKNAKNI